MGIDDASMFPYVIECPVRVYISFGNVHMINVVMLEDHYIMYLVYVHRIKVDMILKVVLGSGKIFCIESSNF